MMRNSWNAVPGLLVGLLALPAARADGDCNDQVALVRLVDGASISLFNLRHGSFTIASIASRNIHLLGLRQGMNYSDFVEDVANDPTLVSVEQDCLVTDTSPEGGTRTFFFNSLPESYWDQPFVEIIDLLDAQRTSRGSGVQVAVIDTGVSPHTLLADALDPGGYDFVDDDADASEHGDHFDNDDDGFVDEMVGHGTFIAGLVLRVAPQARILPVRVMDDEGISSTFLLTAGVYHAIDQGADILNISMGAIEPSIVLSDAIVAADLAGASVVASVGNEGNATPVRYPSAEPTVLAVGATQDDDERAEFSNYGPHLALCAPGEMLTSVDTESAYVAASGTSFSAPLVAGTLALLRRADPWAGHTTLHEILLANCASIDGQNPGFEGQLGAGRLDAGSALADSQLCRGDLDGNRAVELADLSTLLAHFGTVAGAAFEDGDITDDGAVLLDDLSLLLSEFGGVCD